MERAEDVTTKSFTWERGPFTICLMCRKQSFGLLSAGGKTLTMRCSNCRYSLSEHLPPIDKKVLYLDQNLFSILFKVKSGGRLPPGHENDCQEVYRRLRQLVLLQKAVLPHSDIHHDETTVFHSARELRQAYEFFGGDIGFIDTRNVELSQIISYARAFIDGGQPLLSFDVDKVLLTDKNVWLSDMHISVNADYSIFADSIRNSRDNIHQEVVALMQKWAQQAVTFEQVLENELVSFGTTKRKTLYGAIGRQMAAETIEEPMAYLNSISHPIFTEFNMLCDLFASAGVPREELARKVNEFWLWDGNRTQPHLQIFSHLFAALARKVASGQRSVTRGFMNDIMAISTYSPYVDAMFIDRECAALLSERPLVTNLIYKAKIFSMANLPQFIEYLAEMEREVPDEVHLYAKRIYGIN
jgi:hypothetical protein